MKFLCFSLLSLFFTSAALAEIDSVHSLNVKDINGEDVDLSVYKGKVLLFVNTASKCGFTKQYADLVELQKAYADKGVVVLGFPANNFGNQEPGSNQQIIEFCSSKFGVDFPMFSKVSVKGADQSPLFAYLTQADNPDFTDGVKWNFEKFLVNSNGVLVRRFRSNVNPNGATVRSAIDALTESIPSDS
jgi:glutathione peroxidase